MKFILSKLKPSALVGHSPGKRRQEDEMSRGLLAVAFAAMVATSALGAPADWRSDDYAERDEFTQSYTLAPGAVVTVNDISGPVEIETWDGKTAEVHVVRSAPSREELERKKIVV
jgi:hypothetical protein